MGAGAGQAVRTSVQGCPHIGHETPQLLADQFAEQLAQLVAGQVVDFVPHEAHQPAGVGEPSDQRGGQRVAAVVDVVQRAQVDGALGRRHHTRVPVAAAGVSPAAFPARRRGAQVWRREHEIRLDRGQRSRQLDAGAALVPA